MPDMGMDVEEMENMDGEEKASALQKWKNKAKYLIKLKKSKSRLFAEACGQIEPQSEPSQKSQPTPKRRGSVGDDEKGSSAKDVGAESTARRGSTSIEKRGSVEVGRRSSMNRRMSYEMEIPDAPEFHMTPQINQMKLNQRPDDDGLSVGTHRTGKSGRSAKSSKSAKSARSVQSSRSISKIGKKAGVLKRSGSVVKRKTSVVGFGAVQEKTFVKTETRSNLQPLSEDDAENDDFPGKRRRSSFARRTSASARDLGETESSYTTAISMALPSRKGSRRMSLGRDSVLKRSSTFSTSGDMDLAMKSQSYFHFHLSQVFFTNLK